MVDPIAVVLHSCHWPRHSNFPNRLSIRSQISFQREMKNRRDAMVSAPWLTVPDSKMCWLMVSQNIRIFSALRQEFRPENDSKRPFSKWNNAHAHIVTEKKTLTTWLLSVAKSAKCRTSWRISSNCSGSWMYSPESKRRNKKAKSVELIKRKFNLTENLCDMFEGHTADTNIFSDRLDVNRSTKWLFTFIRLIPTQKCGHVDKSIKKSIYSFLFA